MHLRRDTGKYRAALTIGWTPAGNARRFTREFDSHAEAEAWLLEQRVAQGRGELIIPQDETLAERTAAWLNAKRRSVKANTHRDYRDALTRLVLPHLGGVKIKDLKPAHVDAMLSALHEADASTYQLSKAHRFLSMVLGDAVRLELVPRNVAKAVTPPRHTPARPERWSPEDAGLVLAYCQATDHPVARYVTLGLVSGLRREEILGLRWMDVESDGVRIRQTVTFLDGHATISPTAKSEAGYRLVHLDAAGLAAIDGQREYVELARATAGAQWREHGLVFPSIVGTPMPERFLRDHYARLVREAGAPRIRLYDLRSTHGSVLAEAGVNPKLISERLGHADVAFTMRVYVRTQTVEARRAAGVFGEVVAAAQPGATSPGAPAPEAAEGAADSGAANGEGSSGTAFPPDVN